MSVITFNDAELDSITERADELRRLVGAAVMKIGALDDPEDLTMRNAIASLLLDGPEHQSFEPPPLSKDDSTAADVFMAILQVRRSVALIEGLPRMWQRTSRGKLSDQMIDEMVVLIGAWFQEIYNFKLRLRKLLGVIRTTYKQDSEWPKIQQMISQLNHIKHRYLEPICEARGVHVHRVHYSESDLEGIHILSIGEEDPSPFIARRVKTLRRRLRSKWQDRMDRSAMNCKLIAETHFALLLLVVFDNDGQFRPPNGAIGKLKVRK